MSLVQLGLQKVEGDLRAVCGFLTRGREGADSDLFSVVSVAEALGTWCDSLSGPVTGQDLNFDDSCGCF